MSKEVLNQLETESNYYCCALNEFAEVVFKVLRNTFTMLCSKSFQHLLVLSKENDDIDGKR